MGTLKLTLLVSFTFIVTSLFGQSLKNGAYWQSKEYSSERYGKDNFNYLRKADTENVFNNFEQSYFALENAVAQNPFSADVLVRRAKFRMMHGMETEAASDIRLANRINPFAADLYGYNGQFNMLKIIDNEPKRAITSLQLNRRLDYYYSLLDQSFLNNKLVEEEMNLLESVIIAFDDKKYDKAQLNLEQVFRYYPNSSIAYDLQGILYLEQSNFVQAKIAFEKAVELAPDFAIAWHNLGRVHKYLGNLNQAETYINKAIELQQDLTKAYFDRALLYKSKGEEAKALADYDAIIKMQGERYIEAYLNRGMTRKVLGDFVGAFEDINKIISQYPKEAELYLNRGNLHLLFGSHQLAIQDYSKAIQLDENFGPAYYNRGLSYLVIYDRISACADLEKSEMLGYEKAKIKSQYFCVD